MPGSYFYSSAVIVGTSVRNVLISDSRITTTDIDMNQQNITSVKDPVESHHAATKFYVDSSANRIAQDVSSMFSGTVVALVGVEYSNILNLKPGSFLVTITPTLDGAPTATFSVSKSSVYSIGYPARITGTPGLVTLEQLELLWLSGESLKIRKTGAGYDGDYIIDTNTKNVSSLPYEPINGDDSASKSYVDYAIKNEMEAKFGGIKVSLDGIEFSKVINLRPGSYVLAVTAIGITGAPTAAFTMSKGSGSGDANIVRTTSCLGSNTLESLELVWPRDSMLLLRKTGPGYNGMYLVDMNLKNFSNTTIAELPSDTCSKDYVDNKIIELMDAKFGGTKVLLEGIQCVNIENLRPGTYLITINSLVVGGPTASFSISKVSSFSPANSIVRLSSHPGLDSCEILDLTWPEDSMLQLRKTGPAHDGLYVVDFNLKNLGTVVTSIGSDLATREFVENYVQHNLDVEFGGIKVVLNGTQFYNIINPRLGSYIVTITPLVYGGSSATFSISKSCSQDVAHIVRITNSAGKEHMENIELSWCANSMLLVRKNGPFHDGEYLISFNMNNFSSVPPPQIPTDIATVEYVTDLLQTTLDIEYGGVPVNLEGNLVSQVVSLRAGSHIVTVTPKKEGGPTATFSISKSSTFSVGSVVVITSCPAVETFETIELLWPANSHLLLRKTGPNHDGIYVVDFGCKNFSQVPPVVFESDVATKAYVTRQINEAIDIKFGGKLIILDGTVFTNISPLKPGSYLVSVCSQVFGGSTATFSVSKSSQTDTGHVVVITKSGSSLCTLELVWLPDSQLQLRKTGQDLDGAYLVSFNLCNFSTIEEPILQSDVATRSFVEAAINERLQTHFSGYIVNLFGTEFSDITALKAGSYTVNVTPKIDGGPTASFSISKSSVINGEANVVRISNSVSTDNNTNLELIWGQNKKVQLRKSSIYDDGEYLVDFNLRNLSAGPVVIESDIATQSYVNSEINQHNKQQYGGTRVLLTGTEFSLLAALKAGSYLVAISPIDDGGAAATFLVSKSSVFCNAVITRLSLAPGTTDFEELELRWPENSQLQLRKTVGTNDKYFNFKLL